MRGIGRAGVAVVIVHTDYNAVDLYHSTRDLTCLFRVLLASFIMSTSQNRALGSVPTAPHAILIAL